MKPQILELQKQIRTIEAATTSMGSNANLHLSTGAPGFDLALNGGIALGQISEFVPKDYLSEQSMLSFACALAGMALDRRAGDLVFVVDNYFTREWGAAYAPGLLALGIKPSRVLLISPQSREDLHSCLIEAAKTGGLGAFIGMVSVKNSFDLARARKLQLAAAKGGAPCFLLSGFGASSFAPAHLRLEIAPSIAHRAAWAVQIIKSRIGAPLGLRGNFILEYDYAANIMCEPAILAHREVSSFQGSPRQWHKFAS